MQYRTQARPKESISVKNDIVQDLLVSEALELDQHVILLARHCCCHLLCLAQLQLQLLIAVTTGRPRCGCSSASIKQQQ